MTWTWTVTSRLGRIGGACMDPKAAAGWVELALAHGPEAAEVEIAGPGLSPLRIATHGGYLYLPDERPLEPQQGGGAGA